MLSSKHNIMEVVTKHFAVFPWQGEEAFHCEVCRDKTSATKHLRIHRFPDALVLHIKRFKYKVRGI